MKFHADSQSIQLKSNSYIKFWENIRIVDVFVLFLLPVLVFIPFIEEINLLARVIIAAALAAAAWWYPFIKKMSKGNIQLINSCNLLAAGFTLLFIFPGVYITIFYERFERLRPQLFDYYPQSLARISLAGFSFIFGYHLLASKRKSPCTKKVIINKKRIYLIVFVLSILSWLVRLWLLSTGTFFHIHKSDFQFSNYGILAIAFTFIDIEYLSLLTFFIMGIKGKSKKLLIIPVILLSSVFFWYLLSGQRSEILRHIIAVMVCIFLYKTINFKKLLIFLSVIFIIFVAIMSVMETYTILVHNIDVDVSSVNIIDGISNLAEARRVMDTLSYSTLSPLDKTIQRLGDIRSMGVLYPQVPETIGYIYGSSYWGILFTFIPHSIWPSKPDFEIRGEIMKRALPMQYASSPLTLVGEAYVNFSFPGIIIVFILIGMMARQFDDFVLPRAKENPWWGGLLAVMGYRLVWTSLVLGQMVSPILRMMVVTYFFSILTTKTINNKKIR